MRAIYRRSVVIAIGLAGLLAVVGLADVSRTLPLRDGDWPQWRGPNRDSKSTETGLLDKWPEDGPPLLWTAKGLGEGYSSLTIQDGRIFTTGDRGKEQHLICLKVDGGDEIWSTPFGPACPKVPLNKTGARCTPSPDGKLVYALGTEGDLACLETANGKVRWKLNYQKDFDGTEPTWAFGESPLVDGDRLICTPNGKDAMIVALNKLTGDLVWKCAVPEFGKKGADKAGGYSSIVISEGAGVRQYVQLIGRGLIGVAANDGRFLWGYNKIANTTANIPTPIVKDDYVFGSSAYGSGSALVKLVREGDGVKAEEVYFLEPKDYSNHHGGTVLVGDCLYGGNGQNKGGPTCLEFLTGKIKWKEAHGAGSGSAAVLFADGKLYFRYDDGTMALVEANPEEYKLISTFKIPDVKRESWSHPVIAGGKLYLREQDHLLCYKLK
jgi:outer membrane protein assembly factor BamB